jgi:3-oxoacyl-[acyl-carrier-protein] synthase-1
MNLALSHFTIATCLGAGLDANFAALRAGRSGLAPCTFETMPIAAYAGEVKGLVSEPADESRNNKLAALALAQDGFREQVHAARERYGAARIGLFLGTSTSGIWETETAYRRRDPQTGALAPGFDYARTHSTYALANFLREDLHLTGPAFVVSTACAATSKAFASAARMIAAGFCDAAIVGGADTLCGTTLFGFTALGVKAEGPCRPFGKARGGISIGEAAGFALLERPGPAHGPETILLLGAGESSDAYHMSSPHPEGAGARRAMAAAVTAAELMPDEIDYINLHGTATLVGDAAEDRAVTDLFGTAVPCSSTKGFTGHTMGTSGVVEAVFCALALRHGFIPGSPHTEHVDPALHANYVLEGRPAPLKRVLSNSFGFGGVNASLVLGLAN